MTDDERFADLARVLAGVEARLADLDRWCHEQLIERETKIARLERSNAWAQAELGRLRTIIASVGVIAGQAQPPLDEPPEERGT